MGKYTERKHVKPRPRLMHPRAGETWEQRHARRLALARMCEPVLRAWLDLHGIELAVERNGNYWRITGGRRVAEWWPAKAIMVIDREYGKPMHVHDYVQVQTTLRAAWKLKGLAFIEGNHVKKGQT